MTAIPRLLAHVSVNGTPRPLRHQLAKLFITSPITRPKDWQSLRRGSIISAVLPGPWQDAPKPLPPKPIAVAVWKPPTENDTQTILCPFSPPPSRPGHYTDHENIPVRIQVVRDVETPEYTTSPEPVIDQNSTHRYTLTHLDITSTLTLPTPPATSFKLRVPYDEIASPYLANAILSESSITAIKDRVEAQLQKQQSGTPSRTSESPAAEESPQTGIENLSSPDEALKPEQQPKSSTVPQPVPWEDLPAPKPKRQAPRQIRLAAKFPAMKKRPLSHKLVPRFFIFKGGFGGTARVVAQRLAAEKIAKIFLAAGLISDGRIYERNLAELESPPTKKSIRQDASKAYGKLFFVRDPGRLKLLKAKKRQPRSSMFHKTEDDANPAEEEVKTIPSYLSHSKHALLALQRAATSTKRPLCVVVAGTREGMDLMVSRNDNLFGASNWKWDVLNFDDPGGVDAKIVRMAGLLLEDKAREVLESIEREKLARLARRKRPRSKEQKAEEPKMEEAGQQSA
ncbi:hypothetical protein QBC44DRAFT_331597 [Cladorrhinum sp. PSN332]|nr:hypothetical protein QBC44DRAFT_331597 [Cladorrhinum sp. PSN332]